MYLPRSSQLGPTDTLMSQRSESMVSSAPSPDGMRPFGHPRMTTPARMFHVPSPSSPRTDLTAETLHATSSPTVTSLTMVDDGRNLGGAVPV